MRGGGLDDIRQDRGTRGVVPASSIEWRPSGRGAVPSASGQDWVKRLGPDVGIWRTANRKWPAHNGLWPVQAAEEGGMSEDNPVGGSAGNESGIATTKSLWYVEVAEPGPAGSIR